VPKFATGFEPLNIKGLEFPNIVEKFGRFKNDKTGEYELRVIGKRDLEAELFSHLESTKLENYVRLLPNGGVELLETREGDYADISKNPKTSGEVADLFSESYKNFIRLNENVRHIYGDDFVNFVNGVVVNRPITEAVDTPKLREKDEPLNAPKI